MKKRVFVFGEAEKGERCTPLRVSSLQDLEETLGKSSEESLGIEYAIRTLDWDRELIYYRIEEEGFSKQEYLKGIELIQKYAKQLKLCAISIPGVGDREIVEEVGRVCQKHKLLLLFSEKDLYDYLSAISESS